MTCDASPSFFKSYAMDSHGVSCKIVLYGYSPVPKSCTFICVMTSNSVFAVPAPTDGAVKYPLEHISYSSTKYNTKKSKNHTKKNKKKYKNNKK